MFEYNNNYDLRNCWVRSNYVVVVFREYSRACNTACMRIIYIIIRFRTRLYTETYNL